MGILRPRKRSGDAVSAARVLPTGPYSLGQGALSLAGLSLSSTYAQPSTRAEALSWPALNNGMRVYTSITSQLPLKAEPAGPDSAQFLATLDPSMPAGWTSAKTVESLILHGCAYWVVTERYATRFPKHVEYVDNELISEHAKPKDNGLAGIEYYSVGGEKWNPKDVIKFSGILPGILSVGAASIRTALANLHVTRMYAENPQPHVYLTDADGAEGLEDDDALDVLSAFHDAVNTHGSAYLSGLQLNQVGWSAKDLQLVEARQQDAVEAARLLSLPTHYVAAANQGTSLTYTNQIDVRRDVISSLASFAGVIEGRLSLPDVTPRGTVVKFDSGSFYQQVTPDGNATRTNQPDPDNSPATEV